MPFQEDPVLCGKHAWLKRAAPCESGVLNVLRELLDKRLELTQHDGDEFFDAEMNARLTLSRLMQQRKGGKAVVWAHNSHVGDARSTSKGELRNELNVGQLCKEEWGADCSIIGCGTNTGTVAAADEWDEPMQIMKVNPSRADFYERLTHDSSVARFLLDLREDHTGSELRKALLQSRQERFIGVIYRPHTERRSHYTDAILPEQLDAYVWFDESHAVQPFETAQPHEPPCAGETYPFGL
ncbi:hypothetical protein LTR37_020117 [Vermiconidia calcicola]|uniref:Uncharacterized protein n=1 Tax=Vermiconidia calcicola TaxID=1690605 RepID=A0ACC3MCA2_9PEZI|nr:hypothetical protein LTR37_020117 [Vermiconidia calcicola]